MKISVHIRSAVILLILLCFNIKGLVAQEVPFTTPLNDASSLTIQGDMQIISNAITGLSGDQSGTGNAFFVGDTTNYDPDDAYDGGAYNDQLTQDYIDIDSDTNTFSSSSADFAASSSCAQIAYAGLYWSATYYTERIDAANGNDAPQLDNLPFPDPRPDFKTVKLMLPGATNYINVTAEAGDEGTIYDGYRNTSTNPNDRASNDVPYVCYADITAQLQSLQDPVTGEARADGTYTVADVRSATGLTESGSGISAGWVMVIIYEDPTLSSKFFSTNHGFLEIACESASAFELGITSGVFNGQGVSHTQNAFSPGNVPVPDYPTLLSANFVVVDDGNGTDEDGCSALVNAAAVNGNIAVIRRGSCSFTQKVLNAQNAGAVAVVVVNNDGGSGTITMTGTGTGITIPAVMIANDLGNLIIDEINAQTTAGNSVSGYLTDNIPTGCVNPPETFTYTGFQTLPPPNDIRARFGVAALEGDFGLVGDGLAIQAAPLGGFEVPLSADPVNGVTNFFNSSISVDGAYNTARNPASENTLGFDADIFDVPNTDNIIIGNNQTQVDFSASTGGDRYRIFLNMFSIEIIEPELAVFKRVLDINGIDITGGDVVLGQQLFYELTVQNIGNESITSAFIDDILPANVDFIGGTITTPSGVTSNYDGTNREITFTFDDDVVERFDGPMTIRFGVEVVNSCSELRDACSNEIQNIARSTYTGVISGTTNSAEDSVLGLDVCNREEVGASNFLINLDSCDGNFSAFLCTGTLDLTAGGGFPTYTWTDVGTGAVIGNNQTLTVSTGGVYRVDKTGNPDCADLFEIWTVTAFNNVTNPIIPIANDPGVNGNIRTCPITGDPLPEIFLCGATDSQYLDSGFVDATNIVWERLDPAACPAVVRDADCPTLDSTCDPDWVQVATTRDFTVTEAGEYRIRVEFDGNCDIDFYFNVFKNNFEPNLVIVRDIVCAIPGTLRVQNSSNEYEYQLITPISGTVIGYQVSPEFTGLTEQGTYTVNVRQSNGLPTACVFQATEFMEELDSTVSITPVSPSCPSDQGSIQIQVTDGDSNYTYNISSTTTAFTASEGPTTDPNHIFTGLDADVYDVEVLSYDGECIDTQQVTISSAAAFTASAILDTALSCTDAEIRIEVTGGSGNFVYSFQGNPGSQQGSNIFVITTAGTYTFTVADTTTGCTIDTNSVTVNPYIQVEATVAGTDPICPSGLGSILVTVTAGEGPFTYDLDAGTQVVTSNATTQTFSNVAIGTHTINVFDRFGCAINTPIDVTLTGTTAITADIAISEEYRCDDTTGLPFTAGEITISNPQNGNGSYEYSIDGVDFTNTTGIFGGLTDGTYTLYIRDTATAACPVNLGDLTIDPLQEVTDLDFALTAVVCPALESTVTVSATGTNGASSFEYRITAPAANATGFSATDTYTLPAGNTYTFEARTTTDGCVYSESFTINTVDPIAVNGTATAEPTCNLDTDGSLSFEVTGVDLTTTTYSYTVTGGNIPITPINVININTTPTPIAGLGAGTYTITVTDDTTNCTATDTVVINEPTVLGFTTVVDEADCGNNTGIITVTGTGGNGGYEYELRDAGNVVITAYQSSNVFSGLGAATYIVSVRDGNTAAACEFNDTVAVTETLSPTIALAGGDLCYDTTDEASREVTITGGVAPYTYSLNGGAPVAVATTPTFTIPNLTPGSYSVTVTDSNNCTSGAVTFDIEPQLTITANLTKDITCAPNPDATIEFVVTGGNGGNVIDIIRDGAVVEANYTGGSPYSTSVGGTYEIRVTDSESCTATSAPIVVSPYVPLAATAVGTDPFCPGDVGSILVTITAGDGPYTYNLDGGAQVATVAANTYTFNNVAIGAHTITVSDPVGCILTPALNVTINAPTPISATAALTQDYSCDAAGTGIIFGIITVTPAVAGTYEFSIDGVDFTNTTGIFTGLTDGTYTLYIRDTVTAACPVNLGDLTIAPLQEVTDLTFVSPALECPALTSAVVVTATGTNGASSFEYRISAPAGSVTAFSGVNTFTLAAGTYTFESRTTTDGCLYSEDFTVDDIDSIAVNGTATAEPTCNLDLDGSLSFAVSGVDLTTTTYSYTVTGGNIPITPINVININTTPTPIAGLGAGTYTITVTDDTTNCDATDTVVINEPTVLGFTEVVDAADCGASTGIITVTGTGGRGGYEYELRDAAGVVVIVAYQSSNIFTGLAGGTYTVFVRDGNSAAACEFSRQVVVGQTSPGSILAVAGGDACYDTTNQASQWITITGGVGPYSYILDGNAPVAVTLLASPPNPANTFEITGLTPGTYSVFVNDTNNCSTPAINFTIADELMISASLTKDLTCEVGNEAAIIAVTTTGGNGGNTFELNTNGGGYVAYGGGFPFTTLVAGTYQFRVTDGATPTACQAETAVITVSPAPDPVATVVPTDIFCNGDTTGIITFTIDTTVGTGPYETSIDNGGTFSSQTVYSGLAAGTYNYVVRDAKECTLTGSVTVDEPDAITADIRATPVSCAAGTFSYGTVIVENVLGGTIGAIGYTYTLYNSDGTLVTAASALPAVFTTGNTITTTADNFTFGEVDFGTYYITVEDENNCLITTSTVTVSSPPDDLDIVANPGISDCNVTGAVYDIAIINGARDYEIRIVGDPTPLGIFSLTNGLATTFPGPPFVPDATVGGNLHRFTGLLFGVSYIIEIRDAGGCIYRETLPPQTNLTSPTVTLDTLNNISCNGLTDGSITVDVTAFAGVGLQWELFNSATGVSVLTGNDAAAVDPYSLNIPGLGIGNYTLAIATPADPFCTGTIDFSITEPPLLDLTLISQTAANCNIDAEVVVNGQGGTPPYQYAAVLDGAAVPLIGAYGTSSTLVLDPALGLDWDIYVIDSSVTAGAPGFCSAGPLDVSITETPDPVFTSVPAFVVDPCTFDNNYTLTVLATGATALDFGIDDGDTGTADAPVFVAGTPTGNPNEYTYTYTITGPSVDQHTLTVRDANGCFDTDTITVYEELLVDADFTTEANCRDADGTITVGVTGGSDFTINPGNFTFVLTGTDSGGGAVGPIAQVGAGGNIFTLVSVGTYTVTVTDAGIGPAPGCSASDDVTRAIPTDPTVALTSDDPDCVGSTDGFILVTTPVGTDIPYTYQLFDFTGSVQGLQIGVDQTDDPLFDGLGAGEYLVVVTSNVSCSAQNNITLVDPTQVTATATQSAYSCAADNSDVFPDITVTITDGTPDYRISYTGPGITVTNQPVTDADVVTPGVQYIIDADVAGNYDITITDDNNCPFVIPTVVVAPFPIMSNPLVTQVSPITCDAPNAEVVTVSVDRITGNVAGFEFDLLPVGGADVQVIPEDVSGTTSATFNLPGVGSYVIRITDLDTGCSIDTAPYDVAPFDTIVATAALVTEVACFGDLNGELNLDVSMYTGAYNYTVTNTVTGVDFVTSVAGNTAVNPLLITGLPAGTYEIFVEALDTPFCDETTNRVTLASPAELMVVVNPVSDETCNPGDDASIQAVGTGGTGTIDYQLEQPAGTPIVVYGVNTTGLFENLDAGTYTVSVRDASLCEASQDITITAPVATSVVAIETNSLLCFDSVDAAITATASGGQGAGTYLFSITNPNGTTSAQFTSATDMYVFTDLGPGTYTVRVTDNLNCESTVDVTITAPTEVTVTVETVRDPSCTDPTADIQVTGLGGTPPYEYSIDGITFVAGDTFTSLVAGDYQFYVRDDNGCIGGPSNTVPVRAPEDLAVVLDLGNIAIICFSQATGSIDSDVTGGLGNYMYTLTGTDYLGAAVNVGPQTDSFFGDLLAGDYVYSVTSEDCGPEDTPFTITQPTEFVAIATTEDITCNGEADGSIVVTATGGTAPYFYSLYDSAGNALFTFLEDDIDGVAGEHIFDELGADTYRVEVEDINGCPETILDLIINEPLAIDGSVLSTTPESCAGFADGTATVSITGGTVGPDPLNPVYFWSIDGVTYQQVLDPTNLLITDLPGGITTLFIRDFNNSANCEFPLNLDITPGVNLGAVMSTRMDCPVIDPTSGTVTDEIYYIDFILDDNTVTTGTITYYLINPSDGSIVANNTTGTFVVDPGIYEGLVTHDPSLCDMMVAQIEVVEYTPLSVPIAQMTGNPQDPNEYEIIVTGGSGDYTYFVAIIPDGLTVNDLTDADYRELDANVFSIDETADYALRVVDNMGCDVVGVQELTFINIIIPNYFTPDGDGTNDLWYPRQDSSNPGSDPFFFTDMEVKVFDRYGRMLAEFIGDEEGWNGIYQGSELPSGDYWFTIILNDIDNREFTGHFTLYR